MIVKSLKLPNGAEITLDAGLRLSSIRDAKRSECHCGKRLQFFIADELRVFQDYAALTITTMCQNGHRGFHATAL